jgi:sugar transferase (PEP-CTERM system associated)
MLRIFQLYFPVRTLLLLAGEAFVVSASFLAAVLIQFGPDSYIVLNYESGLYKILFVTVGALLSAYYFDLYVPKQLMFNGETYFRLLLVLGLLSFVLAAIGYMAPGFMLGKNVFIIGLVILTFALLLWRSLYLWLIHLPYLCQRVYVLGSGEQAAKVVTAIHDRRDLGMEVVGSGEMDRTSSNTETLISRIASLGRKYPVETVIVALENRRGTMPVGELLDLRLSGMKIEDASVLLEKIAGKIDVDGLHPSAMIFSDGFRVKESILLGRRLISMMMSLTILLACLPLIPFIVLAIKMTSSGPVLFTQERVGRNGKPFRLLKFRSMQDGAEAATGATWAGKNDARITKVGRFLRKTRLDEIPQIWNVLKGDMGFVGPRPERPEFVQWLSQSIPYYNLRHIIRPGLTGWAQVSYEYGASLEQTKQKLAYDLYYIKHMTVSLDLLIMFKTIKTVLLARGSR